MKIYESVEELVGHTPLLKLNKIMKKYNLKANLYAKIELFNPTGSAKDRAAKQMILDALSSGKLKKGATIIEPTSGNTGIGIASIATSMGFKSIIVMPNSMSVERIKLIKAYGAEVVLSDGKEGMKGSIELAEKLKNSQENSIILGQFDNESNSKAHYLTTGPEIYYDLDGRVDEFVASIGTGGTITGTAKYLKEKNNGIKIIGVEPESSPLITKGFSGQHKIQGIGANFIPKILDLSLIDRVDCVNDSDPFIYSRMLSRTEGLSVGISSGAVLKIGIDEAMKEENKDKNIVILLPDSGDRYLSTELFE